MIGTRPPCWTYGRCPDCGSVFNTFSATVWSGGRYTCIQMVLILRGIAQGASTEHLADGLGIDRSHLLLKRHEIQKLLEQRLSPSPLTDEVAVPDEMYQNAREKETVVTLPGRPESAGN